MDIGQLVTQNRPPGAEGNIQIAKDASPLLGIQDRTIILLEHRHRNRVFKAIPWEQMSSEP